MAFKIALLLALGAQLSAASIALQLNRRYRVHHAWVFLSAAAALLAVLWFTSLIDIWYRDPSTYDQFLWTSTLTSLMIAVLMLAGFAMINPLFQQIEEAQALLLRRNQELTNEVEASRAEMTLARKIQQGLLPKDTPNTPGLEIAGASLPAEWTSGDYFDYVQLSDNRWGVLIADASGHGTGPALLISSARAFLRGMAPDHEDPGALITQVNRMLAEDIYDTRFVTAVLCVFDASARLSSYVGAGHCAWLVRADQPVRDLAADHPPLGILPDYRFVTQPGPDIQPGDILVFASDGIVEAANPNGEMLGTERLLGRVSELCVKSSREIVDGVFQLTRDWVGGPHKDDITAVIVKVL